MRYNDIIRLCHSSKNGVIVTHNPVSARHIFSKKKYVAISPRSGAYDGERNLPLSASKGRYCKKTTFPKAAGSIDNYDLILTAHNNDGRKEHFTELKSASRARELEQETTAVIEQSLASNQGNNSLYQLDAESENQRLFEIQVEEATSRSLQDIRAAPLIYDDLHNCVGWPPSDSSFSVFDSSTCNTMRSTCHERDVHSSSPEARVLPNLSLKTVDSLLYTGESSSTEPPPDDDVPPEPGDDVSPEQPCLDPDAFIDDGLDDEDIDDGVEERKNEENNTLTAKKNTLSAVDSHEVNRSKKHVSFAE